jgi:hypothetical protein
MANKVMKRTNFMDGELVSLPLLFLAGGTEVSTGFVLPTNSIIYPHEMWVMVDTVDSTETVDIGILSTESGGDADGFIDGLSVATAGLISPGNTWTAGTNMTYISASTFGVLFLAAARKGANVTVTPPAPDYTPYVCNGVAKTISYTPSSSDTFVGRLIFRLRQLPV